MQAWVWITLGAASAQTLRFMLQRHLKVTRLTTAGATFARFVYSAPLVALGVALYMQLSGQQLPAMGGTFWTFALVGGLCQILATACVVALFAERNFAVGITFKKTEVLLTALVGFVVLGEGLSGLGFLAVLAGFGAVVFLSDPGALAAGGSVRRHLNRAMGLGLASGAFFAVSANSYRGASLALGSGDVALRAGVTLAVVTATQTLGMLAWFALRDRGQIGEVFRAWRVAGLVGLTSMLGSICWFSAYTLQTAAYVNAVGQAELILSLAASALVFRERISRRELIGMGLLLASILFLVLVA